MILLTWILLFTLVILDMLTITVAWIKIQLILIVLHLHSRHNLYFLEYHYLFTFPLVWIIISSLLSLPIVSLVFMFTLFSCVPFLTWSSHLVLSLLPKIHLHILVVGRGQHLILGREWQGEAKKASSTWHNHSNFRLTRDLKKGGSRGSSEVRIGLENQQHILNLFQE